MRKLHKTAIALSVFALAAVPAHSVQADTLVNLFNTGCIVTGSHSHGCFMTNVKGPGGSGTLARGSMRPGGHRSGGRRRAGSHG